MASVCWDQINSAWIIDIALSRMFNQQELQILLGGVNAPVDVQDLRTHTQYGGLYDNDEPTIQTFWKVSIFIDCKLYHRL